ncbi:MAG: ribonuclease Z [Bacteroidota bacterium]
MSLKLTILGCHSATPRSFAFPTSQFLEINNRFFLIDCGEGTQMQLRKHKIKFSKIKHVFISHLHGDHFYGLIGMISTFGLLNRKTELHIFAPKGIKEVIELLLKTTQSRTGYPIEFHEIESKKSEIIFEDSNVIVQTIPLKHRIYTNGFLFSEKTKERKLNIEEIKKYPEIKICDYHNLRKGKDFIKENGGIINNKILTIEPFKPIVYAYCSDTAYNPKMIPLIKNVDLLYHETTFLEDNLELANKTQHSTALQAANIAQKSEAKKLIIGHYSGRYKNKNDFLLEAQTVFSKTELSFEGKEIIIENS